MTQRKNAFYLFCLFLGVVGCATPAPYYKEPPQGPMIIGSEEQSGAANEIKTSVGLIQAAIVDANEQREYFEGKLQSVQKKRKWVNISILALNTATTATLGYSLDKDIPLATSLAASAINAADPILFPGGETPFLTAFEKSACIASSGYLVGNSGAIREYARVQERLEELRKISAPSDADKAEIVELQVTANNYDGFAALMANRLSSVRAVFYGARETKLIAAIGVTASAAGSESVKKAEEKVAQERQSVKSEANIAASNKKEQAGKSAARLESLINSAVFMLRGC